MQGFAGFLFVLFAILLAGIYLSIRREWFRPGPTAGVGVGLSIVLMFMIALAQQNVIVQAVIVGVLVGGAFSIATITAAWYFHSQELRARYADEQYYQPQQEEQIG
jgi:hypothetical protein